MTVQAGLCQTWSETQIVGFLTHRLTSESDLRLDEAVSIDANNASSEQTFVGDILDFALLMLIVPRYRKVIHLNLLCSLILAVQF